MTEDNIQPGGFWQVPDEEADNLVNEEAIEIEETPVSFSDDLISIYTAFRDQVHNPQSVLYPSCGFDGSPARVFDSVTFVDIEDGNTGCIRKLQEEGLDALRQDIKDYSPRDLHDLLIILNPCIPTEWASRHLKSGGFVLANNYHGNASEMHQQPDQFTLWGVIDFIEKSGRKEDYRVTVSRDTSGLFVPVRDEEELRSLRPGTHEFMSESYPHLLRTFGIEPEEKFEEMYVQFQRSMGESEKLPSQRVADRYIFVKN